MLELHSIRLDIHGNQYQDFFFIEAILDVDKGSGNIIVIPSFNLNLQ